MTEIYSVKIFDRICDWFWKILTECIDFTNFSFFLWHHKQSKGRGGVHLYVLPEPPTPAFFSISLCSLLPPKILTLAPACPSPTQRKRERGWRLANAAHWRDGQDPTKPRPISLVHLPLFTPETLTLAPPYPSPAQRKRERTAPRARGHESPTLLCSASPSAHTLDCPQPPRPLPLSPSTVTWLPPLFSISPNEAIKSCGV